ncbi:hypothetical protein C7Y47_15120 [Lysinibacillus sphaericus]|uniref:Uncharacterized protein n=1 Tax=Lysinibacillus sphaericus TaxID=1421 RepID=A0A544UEH5_LYSSH|nr:hypothetical protein [Lysinibacillus sp. SDF0037]TQR30876.1 hypothetical protein C7Y47_15120 [Lysinibacillus sp. SDF0037]
MNEIKLMKEIFNDCLYIGITRTCNTRHYAEQNIQELATSLGIHIAALNESYCLQKEDAYAYEVITAIAEGKKLGSLEPEDVSKYLPLPVEAMVLETKLAWLITVNNILEAVISILENIKLICRFIH